MPQVHKTRPHLVRLEDVRQVNGLGLRLDAAGYHFRRKLLDQTSGFCRLESDLLSYCNDTDQSTVVIMTVISALVRLSWRTATQAVPRLADA